jgi:hypothetical protein
MNDREPLLKNTANQYDDNNEDKKNKQRFLTSRYDRNQSISSIEINILMIVIVYFLIKYQ